MTDTSHQASPKSAASKPPRPQRSPTAYRFDPPVTKVDWVNPGTLSLNEFIEDACRRTGWELSRWTQVLTHGGLFVGTHRIPANDPPSTIAAQAPIRAYSFDREPATIELDPAAILLDHAGLVAVNKPAWLPCQPTRATQRFCLQTQVAEILSEPALHPIHRLDRETSGVTLFARTRDCASWVGKLLREGGLRKLYSAVVSPIPSERAWTTEGYITRAEHPRHSFFRLTHERGESGKHSRSDFVCVEAQDQQAWVEARPQTGRTHQLRVHLAASGTPIVGDSLYGQPWCPAGPTYAERLQLHADTVELPLRPHTAPITIEAPRPPDLLSPKGES